jgi:hypothetical protein|tara:strand:+ start:1009 stop:1611 length:603 start_codon:yes stop_codon:yes gene_type:complete
VAGVLSMLGFWPGSVLIGPSESNPQGHWEPQRLVNLHDRMLGELGGAWDRPPKRMSRGDDWVGDLARYRSQARMLFDEDYAGQDKWMFKDPRLALLLPFWLGMWEQPPLAVVVSRHPDKIAQSLHVRNRMSHRSAIELHRTYVQAARRSAEMCADQFYVSFEALLASPERIIERLCTFVGGMPSGIPYAAGFVDTKLVHA